MGIRVSPLELPWVNQLLHGNGIIDILQEMLPREVKAANDQKEEVYKTNKASYRGDQTHLLGL